MQNIQPFKQGFLLSLSVYLLVALSGCSPSPTEPALLQTLESDAVVLAFGDSLTYGTGAAQNKSYPVQLAALINRKVVNAGVPGETTAGGRTRLASVFKRVKPDLVFLCLGGNDFLRRQDRSVTKENLRAMLLWIQAQYVPVVLIAIPDFGIGLTGKLKPAELYLELAEELNIPLVEKTLPKILAERSLKTDTVHPNAAGYQQLAEELAEFLQKSGAIN